MRINRLKYILLLYISALDIYIHTYIYRNLSICYVYISLVIYNVRNLQNLHEYAISSSITSTYAYIFIYIYNYNYNMSYK